MRWLLLTQDFPPGFVGGVASWAWDAATALTAAGHEVRVLARSTGRSSQIDAGAPFAIHRVRGRSWGRWQGTWLGLAARPHLRWAHRVLAATWPCATGLPRRHPPLHIAVHGSEVTQLAAAPAGLARLARRAERWHPVSRFLADRLSGLARLDDSVTVTPMPLSLQPLPEAPARAGLVVVARLTPLKGVDRALRIAAALDLPLRVVGEGPARPALQALASPSVVFLGRQDRADALRELRRARALVLLPRVHPDGRGAEGLGLVALEAAVQGTPTLGCRTGGVAEAVGPGAVLADPDAPDLEVVRALLADPEAGARAAAWVATHHGPAAFVRALGGG